MIPRPMRLTSTIRWAIISAVALCAGPASAAEPPASDSAPSLAFLEYLWHQGDLTGLRTEALRVTFVGGPDAEAARYLGDLARMRLDDVGGQDDLQSLVDTGTPLAPLADLALAQALVAHHPLTAADRAQAFSATWPADPHQRESHVLASYAFVDAGRFEEARTALSGVDVPPALTATLAHEPHWRRPVAGALLSAVLPGAGQLYSGRGAEAASALLVNALFAGGLVLAIRERSWAAVGVIGFFELGFYAGNIYGGADAAIRWNRRARDRALAVYAPLEPLEPLMP